MQTRSRLPNSGKARISEAKLRDYLLNPAHEVGFSKADFFSRFGFRRDRWKLLREALLLHARSHSVASISSMTFGRRFTIEGKMMCPDGRTPEIRVVWQIDTGQVVPRLITAYPIGANL